MIILLTIIYGAPGSWGSSVREVDASASESEKIARFNGRSTIESGDDVGVAFRFPNEDVLGSESTLPERVESENVESGKMQLLSSEHIMRRREKILRGTSYWGGSKKSSPVIAGPS